MEKRLKRERVSSGSHTRLLTDRETLEAADSTVSSRPLACIIPVFSTSSGSGAGAGTW